MKNFFNVIFYAIASIALGLVIGVCITNSQETIIITVASCTAGIFYLTGFILTGVIIRTHRRQKDASVSLQKKDIVLTMNKTYTVGRTTKIRPGEYKVLATNEENKTFNIRLNDYVKEYKHNTNLVLSLGDTITACSSSVILR